MKRRNFIKGVGLVGAAAYIDPFSLIKPVLPFKVGDILEIFTLMDYGYDGGVIAGSAQNHKGLRHIEVIDSGDDEHYASYYQVEDLDKFKKSIIHYMDNGFQDQLKEWESQVERNDYEEWPIQLEFYELCLACIIIDDKKLWESICNNYFPYKEGLPGQFGILVAWDDYQERLETYEGCCASNGRWHSTYNYSGIRKLANAKIVNYTYSDTREYGGRENHWENSYEVVDKSFPYNEVNESNYKEYEKIKRLLWG